MKIGLISDVHANLHALDRVLGELADARVDRILCAGDIVGYGPFPNETVDRLAEVGVSAVAGNHDLIAAGLLGEEGCTPVARDSLRWTREVLSKSSFDYLRALPSTVESDGLLMTHGSLEDPWRYVRDSSSADPQLTRASSEGAFVLILGHTHKQWLYGPVAGSIRPDRDGVWFPVTREHTTLLNPGSVGHSRSRRALAAFAVLDLGALRCGFRQIAYDDKACRKALIDKGLSPRLCHTSPSLWRSARRRLRHLANRDDVTERQEP